MVACAYTTGRIEIKSDGTPWRPVIHIQDVCSAFIAGLLAPSDLISGRSYNVGIPDGNFTVKQLAEAAQRAVPGSDLIFTGEHSSDSRTYRVSFNRILTELKNYYVPIWDLDLGGRELVDLFNRVGLTEELFRGERCNRLNQLDYLKKNLMTAHKQKEVGIDKQRKHTNDIQNTTYEVETMSKQAKTLTAEELRRVLDYTATRKHSIRNRALVLMSFFIVVVGWVS
jgi:hypothetical protein